MKLIDKDALVAEIDKLSDNSEYHESYYCGYRDGNNDTLDALKEKIDTLEVKEVDLEKEIEEHVLGMPMSEFTHESEVEDFWDWARKSFRHFFELGLKTAQKGE